MTWPELAIDFRERAFIEDPYPVYEQIRAAGRVVFNSALNVWMLTGYDDCVEVLRNTGETFRMMHDPEIVSWFDAPNMITVDGAEHHRLRHCLTPIFTKNAVARWERRVVEVVDELLSPLVDGKAAFDLIADFTAFRLSSSRR